MKDRLFKPIEVFSFHFRNAKGYIWDQCQTYLVIPYVRWILTNILLLIACWTPPSKQHQRKRKGREVSCRIRTHNHAHNRSALATDPSYQIALSKVSICYITLVNGLSSRLTRINPLWELLSSKEPNIWQACVSKNSHFSELS